MKKKLLLLLFSFLTSLVFSIEWNLTESGTLFISGKGNIPNFNTTNTPPWQEYANQITNIEISEGIISIGNNAFSNCTMLQSVSIPESNIYIGNEAFYSCPRLQIINIPNSTIYIGNSAFQACYSIENIEIPNSIKYIGNSAFSSCYKLKSVTFRNNNENNSNTTKLELPKYNNKDKISFYIEDSIATKSYNNDKSLNLKNVTKDYIKLNNPDNYDKENKWLLFSKKSFADEINISILEAKYDNIFDKTILTIHFNETGAKLLNEVSSKNIDKYMLIMMNGKEIALAKIMSVLSSGEITVSTSAIQLNDVKDHQKNTILEKINFDRDLYIGIKAFSYCSSLENINLPQNLRYINDSTFEECTSLSEIKLPKNLLDIGYSTFLNTSLNNIELPTSITSIKYNTFKDCLFLNTITLNDKLKRIGPSAFENCYDLSSLSIPESVENIESKAFSHCNKINNIYLLQHVDIKDDSFPTNCKIIISEKKGIIKSGNL